MKLPHHLLPMLDILLVPLVYQAAWLLKKIRRIGIDQLPHSKNVLFDVGIYPITDHYYEPQFDHRHPSSDFSQDRTLPGIDWNIAGQLEMLASFKYAAELSSTPQTKTEALEFYLQNGSFESGDAEYWYQMIRTFKPKRIIEIGSGNSTLMANKAIRKNQSENANYHCDHICVEPYEMPWLEEIGITVLREKVEDLALSFFSQLEENDILFIDSSHMIRPQGDVTFEYLELLPSLSKGVIVHVHDIFSPKNYLSAWLQDKILFWNEQYLLEAFLTHNGQWKILGALNYLQHHHYDQLKAAAPFLSPAREPGSFYMQKIA